MVRTLVVALVGYGPLYRISGHPDVFTAITITLSIYPDKRSVSQSTKVDRLVLIGDKHTRNI